MGARLLDRRRAHSRRRCTLIEGSVQTTATLVPSGRRRLDVLLRSRPRPRRRPRMTFTATCQASTVPYPLRSSSAYEGPGTLPPGASERAARAGNARSEPSTDPYNPTPDELYALGKGHFDAGRFTEAGEALEPLFAGYSLRDDIGKDASRMLLLINIRQEQARKIVQYFEVVKEKAPELVLTFDQLLAIGKAYREINEYERAMIVWRADRGQLPGRRPRGRVTAPSAARHWEAIAYLVRPLARYPNTASIESDFFGLSQVVAQTASQAFANAGLRPRDGKCRRSPSRSCSCSRFA